VNRLLDRSRQMIEPWSKARADRYRLAGRIQDGHAGDLLTVLELVNQALQFAIRLILEEGLCGLGQRFGQDQRVSRKLTMKAAKVSAHLDISES
jgi:hypothetical protein